MDIGYRLYGQDFVIDLLGIMDLLWPLVLLMLEGQSQWCPGWKFAHYVPKARKQLRNIISEKEKVKPSTTICPRLEARLQEVKDFRYGKSELVEGWLVIQDETGKPVNWTAREVPDCISDLKNLGENIIQELDDHFENCLPPLDVTLSKCLDFGVLFMKLRGKREDGRHPVNKVRLGGIGIEEFTRCVKFVSHVRDKNLELSAEFAFSIYWKMKSALVEVIWGKFFLTHFPIFFKKVNDVERERVGKGANVSKSVVEIRLTNGMYVNEFETSPMQEFTLLDTFLVELNDGQKMEVILQEDAVIKALYTDPEFYNIIGLLFCLVFDIMYTKSGTESVAESFNRVVGNQEMAGGQSIETLAARSKVDWCLPLVIQCESALEEMAKLYINGSKEEGLKSHPIPIHTDRRSQKDLQQISKVIDRIHKSTPRLPFLL